MKTRTHIILPIAALAGFGLSLTAARAELLFYEPFEYPDGVLNGQPAGPLGSAGVWVSLDTLFKPAPYTALGTWWVHPEGEVTGQGDDLGPDGANTLNLFDGTVANLPHKGGFAGPPGPEDRDPPVAAGTRSPTGNMDATISLDPSVTATFQAGTTTWFSYVASHADNRNQGSPQFLLCTDPIVNGDRGWRMQTTNGGNGIGGTGGQTRANLFDVYPQYYKGGVKHQTPGGYQDGTLGGHDGRVITVGTTGTSNATLPAAFKMPWTVRDADGYMGVPNIVIGKIEWDAPDQPNGKGGFYDVITMVKFEETDVLTEAAFDALVALKPELSSRNWPAAATPFDPDNPWNKPDLDQSLFNLISISSLKFWIDEIRIATTFEDVIGAGPGATFPLRIAASAASPGDYDFEWDSQAGKVYDLVTSTDLATPVSTWPVYDPDGEGPNPPYADIPATGTTTTLTEVPGDGAKRFFAMVERNAPPPPPLFSWDFEDDNGGFTATGTPNDWAWGAPNSNSDDGLVLTTGNSGSTNCWATNLGTGGAPSGVIDSAANSILRSPDINLTGVTGAKLRFAAAYDAQAGDIIEVVLRDVATGNPIGDPITPVTATLPASSNWTTLGPFDLSAADNTIIYLEFRYDGTDDTYLGLYIDDVVVTQN